MEDLSKTELGVENPYVLKHFMELRGFQVAFYFTGEYLLVNILCSQVSYFFFKGPAPLRSDAPQVVSWFISQIFTNL